MRKWRGLLLWVLAGLLGLALLAWAYPRAFPLLPRDWTICRQEAVEIALERLRDLGEPVEDPYVVTVLATNLILERRLSAPETVNSDPRLRSQVTTWEVYIYPPGTVRDDWLYRAVVSLSGELLSLRLRLDPQAEGQPDNPSEGQPLAQSAARN
ncbi:MAG TPA: hypothetical protein VJ885_15500, partial [Thermoanaerobaculia bacterium]|nr:hypothetical protein [Thermoanaerobaculia bacterium]